MAILLPADGFCFPYVPRPSTASRSRVFSQSGQKVTRKSARPELDVFRLRARRKPHPLGKFRDDNNDRNRFWTLTLTLGTAWLDALWVGRRMRSIDSNENFELLAARYAHSILAALRPDRGVGDVGPAREADTLDGRAQRMARPPISRHEQPASADRIVEFVGRSALFAPAGNDPDWLIFIEDSGGPAAGFHEFDWLARIGAEIDDAAFVEQAFRCLLGRAVDAIGLANYLSLLRNGELDRRDVLRSILSSNEAQSLGRQYLVVPEDSPWLAAVAPRHKTGAKIPRIRIAA